MLRDALAIRRPLAGFASIGVMWGAFAAQVPVIKAQVGAGDAEWGMVLSLSALGLLTALALAPWLERRAGELALPLAAALMAAAFLIPAGAGGLAVAAGGLFLVAVGSGVTDVLANARLSEVEAREGRSLMNLGHAGFSFAYAAAALATGLAREAGLGPVAVFGIVGAVVLCLAACARAPVEAAGPDAGLTRLPWRIAVLCGGLCLLAFQIEGSVEQWSALHVERTLGGGAAEGAFGPAMLGLTMGIGRLGGQAATRLAGPMLVAGAAGVLTALGAGVAAAAPGIGAAYAGFALLGLGVSVIGPLAIAEAGRRAPPGGRTGAVATVAVIGFAGFFVGPPLMGLVSEAASLRWAIAMLAGLGLGCAAFAAALGRQAGTSQSAP